MPCLQDGLEDSSGAEGGVFLLRDFSLGPPAQESERAYTSGWLHRATARQEGKTPGANVLQPGV